MFWLLICRCNDASKVKQYETIARKVQYAINDTEIFHLTGCVSKCDKYHFKAYPRSEIEERTSARLSTSMLMISFLLPNGRNELKEQVRNDHTYIASVYKIKNFIASQCMILVLAP